MGNQKKGHVKPFKQLLSLISVTKTLTIYSIDTHFNPSATDSFWKRCGKEEIAHNEQFLLFPQCFLLNQKLVFPFVNICNIISLFAAEFEEPKIGI